MCYLHLSAEILDNPILNLLEYETRRIQSLENSSETKQLQAYLSRAETLILVDQPENALYDLNIAYELATKIENDLDKNGVLFRCFFDMIIANVNAGFFDMAKECQIEFEELIHSLQCGGCNDRVGLSMIVEGSDQARIFLTHEIYGPDHNVPGLCEEVVKGTADAMRVLATLAKTIKARAALMGSISALETKCMGCCATGEFWKTCVGPIADKWKEWNDKYELFRIPPDPYWD